MNNWDLEISLLQQDGFGTNKSGDKIPKYKEIELLGYEKPISRGELLLAGQSNIEISKIIVIHSFEYNNEQLVKIDGVPYQIVNTYKISNEEIELKLKSKKGLS
ncbi:phage head closure protein [Enterococcus sp. HY326]|uniref:phage head closure protein n=1 Tax=Enterococcus sp. HY326 TaxID=2971265 RepID=UPI00223ED6FB|nr:phage head closure protein [Enterococcus sp. HY326]